MNSFVRGCHCQILIAIAMVLGLASPALAARPIIPETCANAAADPLFPIPSEVQKLLAVPASKERPYLITDLKPVREGYVVTLEFQTNDDAVIAMYGSKAHDELGIAIEAVVKRKDFFGKLGITVETFERHGEKWARFTLPSVELLNARTKIFGFQFYASKSENGLAPPIEALWHLARSSAYVPYNPLTPYALHDVWGHFEGYFGTPREVWRLYQSRARLLMRMLDSPIGRELLNTNNPSYQKFVGELIDSVVQDVDRATGTRRAVFAATAGGESRFTPQGSIEASLIQYDNYDLNLEEWIHKVADTIEVRAASRLSGRLGFKLTNEEFQKIQALLNRRIELLKELPERDRRYRLSEDIGFTRRLKNGDLLDALRARMTEGVK